MIGSSGRKPRHDPRTSSVPPPVSSGDSNLFAAGVGDQIRQARQQLGWTQTELAQRANISPNYVARLERGELGPSLYVASQISAALGITLEALTATSAAARRTGTRRKIP